MLENPDDLNKIILIVKEILKKDNRAELYSILLDAIISVEESGYDNWNGGISLYKLFIQVDLGQFLIIKDDIENLERSILDSFNIALRHIKNEGISEIIIVPNPKPIIDWSKLDGNSSKDQLIKDINFLKNTMVAVSTGKQSISNMNEQYKIKYTSVESALQKIELMNPNPHADLSDWYGKWSSSFPTFSQRRSYLNGLYDPLIKTLLSADNHDQLSISVDLSEWQRIERSINEIRRRQTEAQSEEQFQSIGLLCRETIISLAQVVFDKSLHQSPDGTVIGETDAKRMLESYIQTECTGSSGTTLRKYMRSTIDLANELTHKRSATQKDVSICVIATITLVNLIGIIAGKEAE